MLSTCNKIKPCLLIVLFPLLILISEKTNAQVPNWIWAKGTGSTNTDVAYNLVYDATGNIYATGVFQGTVDFDPGPASFNLTAGGVESMFISKFDPSGNFIWAKASAGGAGSYTVSLGLFIDASGNIYCNGGFGGTIDIDPGPGVLNLTAVGSSDNFVCKFSNAGNLIWAKAMGGTGDDLGLGVAADASGNVYSAGYFEQTVDFDPGAGTFNLSSAGIRDVFVSKLDNSGNHVWTKRMGSTADDGGYAMKLDASGNVFVTGGFSLTVDFDPNAGVANLTSAGGRDIFICKLDAAGNYLWAKGMGSASDEAGTIIVTDASGNPCFTGSFQGTVDFDPGAGIYNLTSAGARDIFILKLTSTGNFIWAAGMGGSGSDGGYSVALDASGNVYSTGAFTGTADFDPGAGVFNLTSVGGSDIFVSKLSSTGSFLWAKATGGTNNDDGEVIIVDASGIPYLAGEFASLTVPFGTTTLTNAGSATNDMFIARLESIVTGVGNTGYDDSISISPNPAHDHITITFKRSYLGVSVTILDINGKTVYSTFERSATRIDVDTKGLPGAVYFVRIQSPKLMVTRKVIIQK